jgi:uncharacterized membrane protein YgdD (TMEM256/DUF423 family)
MARKLLIAGFLLGALATVLGAFGAHALKDAAAEWADADKRLGWWGTAVDYQFRHALLLVGVGLLALRTPTRAATVSGVLVGVGVVLFCGSLYVMTVTGNPWLGRVTPVGGLALIGAWISAAVAAFSLGRATGE